MSKSAINQKTAKATLTQMLNVIFQRMESRKGDNLNLQLSAGAEAEEEIDMGMEGEAASNSLPFKTPNTPQDDMPSELYINQFVKNVLDQVCASNDVSLHLYVLKKL